MVGLLVNESKIIRWLSSGDVSVQYQAKRDLLEVPESLLEHLRLRIAEEGWGRQFLEKRDAKTGLWGQGVYSPNWISTHYTLLDLKNLGLSPTHPIYRESSTILLDRLWHNKGWVAKGRMQDQCVSAMLVSICCYAGLQSEKIDEIIDYLLDKQYPDGGWNCNWDHGDGHSSVHTTLTVLEALRDYAAGQYPYRAAEAAGRVDGACGFLLNKRLFRSVHTGEVIDKKMLMLSYPCRWKYDILRCLDYFQSTGREFDGRMEEALDIVAGKMRKNNRWPVQQRYAGQTHFDMEPTGEDSRWNTLRVLRVMKRYRSDFFDSILNQD
jgi:hypothetical protein